MTTDQLSVIADAARRHANNATANIAKASSREEHIRLTQLAFEATWLADQLALTASPV
jgi:hypothetical protein